MVKFNIVSIGTQTVSLLGLHRSGLLLTPVSAIRD